MSNRKKMFSFFCIALCLFVALQTQALSLTSLTPVKLETKEIINKSSKVLPQTSAMKPDDFQIAAYAAWIRYYGESGMDTYLKSVVNTSDGGYFLGTQLEWDDQCNINLVKTNSSGLITWSDLYGDGGVSKFWTQAVLETPTGYMVVGYCTGYSVFLLNLDFSGNILWFRTYSSGSADINLFGYDVKRCSDGGYIIVGRQYIVSSNTDSLLILKTDSAGYIAWGGSIGSSQGPGAKVIIDSTNGNAIVYAVSPATLYRVTLSGTITAWANIDPAIVIAPSIKQTNDGGFILAGLDAASSQNIALAKLNNAFQFLWRNTFATSGTVTTDFGENIEQSFDGGYFFSCPVYDASMNRDIILVKTDVNGSLEDNMLISFSNGDSSVYCHYTTDDGWVLGGNIPPADMYGKNNCYLGKFFP